MNTAPSETEFTRIAGISSHSDLPADDADLALDPCFIKCLNLCLQKVAESSIAQTLTELQDRHETLRRQRDQLIEKLHQIDERMLQIRAAMGNLAALNDPLPPYEGQMADAIRAILSISGMITAKEIRDSLKAMGYDLQKHSNALAAVHGVLKRLVESQGGVATDRDQDGIVRYFWDDVQPPSDTVLQWLSGTNSPPSDKLSPTLCNALRRHAVLDSRRKARN